MYVGKDELTLTEEDVDFLATVLCEAGYNNDLTFISKANRDAVYRECVRRGAKLKRSSMGHSILDPRYTVEGRNLPDLGLGNDKQSYAALYELTRIV